MPCASRRPALLLLSYQCGRSRGRLSTALAQSVNRVTCYSDDCQAFAHQLGRPDILDVQGGTGIVQIAPATLSFSGGCDSAMALQLSEKGVYRFYMSCCQTPLGNTPGPPVSFIDVPKSIFEAIGLALDSTSGPRDGEVYGQFEMAIRRICQSECRFA